MKTLVRILMLIILSISCFSCDDKKKEEYSISDYYRNHCEKYDVWEVRCYIIGGYADVTSNKYEFAKDHVLLAVNGDTYNKIFDLRKKYTTVFGYKTLEFYFSDPTAQKSYVEFIESK